MAKCKKCGAELKETNVVNSVVAGTNAAKEIFQGDIIVSIDDYSVKNKSEIEKALAGKKSCKISILHNEQRKTINIENPEEYIKDIEFQSENVCHKCGAKQKENRSIFIVGIGIVTIILAFVFILSVLGKQKNNSNKILNEDVRKQETVSEFNIVEEQTIPFVMSEKQKEKVQNDIEKLRQSLKLDNNTSRFEIREAEDVINDEFNRELHKKLEDLYVELNGEDDEEDDNPFGDVINGSPVEKESKGGPGLGENKTKSDRPDVDKAVRIFFDYGSYLNTNKVSMASYLKGTQTYETEADIEYAEFYLALDDLLKTIPESKRSKAVFVVVGYADTSFRNGIPDKGEESQIFNTELSLNRAKEVMRMLINDKNIRKERFLEPEGRGFENLIRENGKENHEKSRRVEVFCYVK